MEEKSMSSELTLPHPFESNLTWHAMMSGELVTFTLLIVFTVLSALEFIYPKRKLPLKQLCRSYQTNVSLFVFNSIVISLLSAAPLLMVAEHYSNRGLLSHISNSAWKALLSFLLLDLMLYFWHKASHRFDCLDVPQSVSQRSLFKCFNRIPIHIVELLIITALKQRILS
jgi:sterol desaturase/sphingolipid hydroxylase (fatty acid hydroxylase superfamily)